MCSGKCLKDGEVTGNEIKAWKSIASKEKKDPLFKNRLENVIESEVL